LDPYFLIAVLVTIAGPSVVAVGELLDRRAQPDR
jgi:hypothetical protein